MDKERIIEIMVTKEEKRLLEIKAKGEGLSLSEYTRNHIVSVLGNKQDDKEYDKLMIEMMTYIFKMTGKLCRKNLDEVEIKAIKKQSEEQLRLWGYIE
jgi:hypothetical protein